MSNMYTKCNAYIIQNITLYSIAHKLKKGTHTYIYTYIYTCNITCILQSYDKYMDRISKFLCDTKLLMR